MNYQASIISGGEVLRVALASFIVLLTILLLPRQILAAPCTNVPTSGSYTVTESCTFPNSGGGVDGVDDGTGSTNTAQITMSGGGALTVQNGQTVARGSILMSGGTITMADGGVIQKGPVWVIDDDGDGYPDEGPTVDSKPDFYLQSAQPTGGVRRNTLSGSYSTLSSLLTATIDCNSSSATAFINYDAFTDGDGDGYPASSTISTVCDGAALTSGVGKVTKVSAGTDSSCSLHEDGRVACWGANTQYQLGDGTINGSHTPVDVSGISTAVDIAVGIQSACAVLANGTVQCWGYGANYAMGDGSTTNNTIPSVVTGISTATKITAGSYFYCALLSDSTVSCWGLGTSYQMGDGVASNNTTPGPVSTISTATQIAAGGTFACARLSNSTVSCWGAGSNYQLGNGTTNNNTTPGAVSNISTATQVTAGNGFGCARLSDSTIQCWGLSSSYQTGDGSTASNTTPGSVTGISTATSVSAGGSYACAVLSDNTAQCWGLGSSYQLGDGSNTNNTTPNAVSGADSYSQIGPGSAHACATLTGGTFKCWGSNTYGQLGSGNTSTGTTPTTSNIGSDCNDGNASVWRTAYTDTDSDGYADGASTSCVGAGATYKVLVTGTNDCATSDANRWSNQTVYTDTDQDGYYAGAGSASQCTGAWTSVSGRTYYINATAQYYYLANGQQLGADCNDSNASLNVTCTPPNAPTSPLATVDNANKKITVSWNASTGSPTGYYVYWCTGTSCSPSTQIDVGNVTSYQHTSLTCGTTYGYNIVAYNAAGNSSATANVYGTMNSTNTTCYTDADNDGQRPSGYSSQAICGSTCPSGWTKNTANTDCADNDANTKVGQTSYFSYAGGNGYDYNCDLSSDKEVISWGYRANSGGTYYTQSGVPCGGYASWSSRGYIATLSGTGQYGGASCGGSDGAGGQWITGGFSQYFTDASCTNEVSAWYGPYTVACR